MRSLMMRRGHLAGKGREAGMTMVVVLAALVILLTVVLGSAAFLSSSTKFSRYEQDSDLAQAAAQSGLNELLALLRTDASLLEDIAIDASNDEGYCELDAVGGPDADVFADVCGWDSGSEVGWARLSPHNATQYYHYAVTYYDAVSQTIEVLATGKSNTVSRSLKARLSPETTPMFLYLSNYELADPTDYTTYADASATYLPLKRTSGACGGDWKVGAPPDSLSYAWEIAAAATTSTPRPPRVYTDYTLNRSCLEPVFEDWDQMNGRFHSNDTVRSEGARFSGGEWTTSNPACQNAKATDSGTWNSCVIGTAVWSASNPPSYAARKELPSTDSPDELSASGIGCRYEGPTRIILKGDQMQVWSKQTTTNRPNCGSPLDLASSDGATVPIPTDQLIFVATAEGVAAATIEAGGIGGPAGRELPLGTYTASAKPTEGASYTVERAMIEAGMEANVGNAFVEGTVHVDVTIATRGSIVLTGDLVADVPEDNLVGLLAEGSVEIYNPVLRTVSAMASTRTVVGSNGKPVEETYWAWNTELPTASTAVSGKIADYDGRTDVLRIDAAIHAVSGSFRLQNWKQGGDLGTLQVYGSIAQNFRGVVAWESEDKTTLISGYRKSYIYNEGLTQGRPVLFPPISGGNWVVPWVEKAETPMEIRP